MTNVMVHLVLRSDNKKVGRIPVSTSSKVTCPDACPLLDAGCYAEVGSFTAHWRKVTAGERGITWEEFCAAIADLPDLQAWRHNQAGDLPGVGDIIDGAALASLVGANAGKRGWTYTHKPVLGASTTAAANRDAIAQATAGGFAVNLSADTLTEADQYSDLGIAPVVVLQDGKAGERHDQTTPAGRHVRTCPATYMDTTCADCLLCARQDRKVIVGFPVHGARENAARAVARGDKPVVNIRVRISRRPRIAVD